MVYSVCYCVLYLYIIYMFSQHIFHTGASNRCRVSFVRASSKTWERRANCRQTTSGGASWRDRGTCGAPWWQPGDTSRKKGASVRERTARDESAHDEDGEDGEDGDDGGEGGDRDGRAGERRGRGG